MTASVGKPAEIALTACIGQRPQFAWSHLLRGRAYLQLNDLVAAVRDLQLVHELQPNPRVCECLDSSVKALRDAINALSPGPGGTLIATDGSTTRPYQQWAHDLMERGRTGRVLSIDIASGRVRTVASGLQYAFGVCAAGEALFVSESWRHRVIAIAPDGSQRSVLRSSDPRG